MDNDDIQSCYYRANLYNGTNLAFLDCAPDGPNGGYGRGTILLIHGFPETSYQWRGIIPMLTQKGYRVLAPDYRGAGESSKTNNGFAKVSLAADMVSLLDQRDVAGPVHVVGHDIGGLVAYALASRWSNRITSLCVSECLIPGTHTFDEQVRRRSKNYFHYAFHGVENLPESLISGREKTYIEFFVSTLCYRVGAFNSDIIQHYANIYSQPGALRCALDLYRAFDRDAEDLSRWLQEHGKCTKLTLILSGEHSSFAEFASNMMLELVEEDCLTAKTVEEAGHFVPEENPHGFVETLLAFLDQEEETE